MKDKTVYTVLGIDIEGNKDILGLWIAETETAKYWLTVLTEIKNRGVKEILIITSDDLPCIEDAIKGSYPESGLCSSFNSEQPEICILQGFESV